MKTIIHYSNPSIVYPFSVPQFFNDYLLDLS